MLLVTIPALVWKVLQADMANVIPDAFVVIVNVGVQGLLLHKALVTHVAKELLGHPMLLDHVVLQCLLEGELEVAVGAIHKVAALLS